MAVNAQPSSAYSLFNNLDSNEQEPEPYSYAAEHALSERERPIEELEAAVKETPPRLSSGSFRRHIRSTSSPRALGDVMDESEKMLPLGSPGLRHTKGRLEDNAKKQGGESYADIVKHEPAAAESDVFVDKGSTHSDTAPAVTEEHGMANGLTENGTSHESYAQITQHEPPSPGLAPPTPALSRDQGNVLSNENAPVIDISQEQDKRDSHAESYAEVVKHEPTSPAELPGEPKLQVEHEDVDRTDSAKALSDGDDLNAYSKDAPRPPPPRSPKRVSSSNVNHAIKQAIAEDTKPEKDTPGTLVYENFQSRSGTNLASIKPDDDFVTSLTQRENKDISSEPPHEREAAEDATAASPTQRRKLVAGRQAGAGWATSVIRWAPLNVPLQRRLQTLAVFLHSMSIPGMLALFFLLCCIPILWPVIVPYLIYVLLSPAASDGRLALRSERIRRSKLWSLFASYFPARLHRSVELEPTRKYIFGYHPHGIISHGAFAAFATEALGFSQLFPGITNTLLTLETNFRTPIYRDWALRVGLASVSRESCENLLTRGGPNGEGMGRAITIVIGGARESLDAKPGTLNLVLAKRKGFIKLAIRTGADLVPVLGFGENDMYDQIDSETHPWIHKGQMLIKKFMGFTVPLFHARGIFNYDVGIMPYRRPVNIVVGRPIKTVQNKKPDPDYVNKLHKEYTDELLHMWDEWKDTFASERKAELQIIE